MGKYKCRGIRANWNDEMMEEALRLLKDGCSQRVVEQRTGIPRRTLRNHSKSGITKREIGRRPVLTIEQENSLEQRIIRLAKIGLPLTPKALRRSVYSFIKENKIELAQKKKNKQIVGKDWYSAFLKRHPRITKRKAQSMNPARSQKLNKFIVTDYFVKLNSVLEEFNLKHAPDRIFNMDEKGCRLTLHHQQTVLALKGSKRVHLVSQEHGENVTIVACVNALGNCIPPMLLFKGIRQKPTFSDNLPNGSAVCMSPKGSMTTELFCKWLKHFSKYKPIGKVLLIFDGAACHLDVTIAEKAEEYDIELLCLPSNTTHELQPLDKSVFRSFEHHWDDELLKYWDQNPDRRLTKERFAHVFTPVWEKCMTVANISSGFRATGIYPYNCHAIPEEAFAPSTISRRLFETSDEDDDIPLAELRRKLLRETKQYRTEPLLVQQSDAEPLNDTSKNSHLVVEQQTVAAEEINRSVPGPSGCSSNGGNIRENTQKKLPHHSPNKRKSFEQILKTPDAYVKTNVKVRRKAFNYRSQHVKKDLFKNENSNEKSGKNENINEKSSKTPKNVKKIRGPEKENFDSLDESWYCFLCQTSQQLSMRNCIDCHQWVHEDCIGMTSDDEDDFICPTCR